jgi:tetratricopeptide (TPR) repeat protein
MRSSGGGRISEAAWFVSALLGVFCLLAGTVPGQVVYENAPGTGILIFDVFAERTTVHLDQVAFLKLVNVNGPTVSVLRRTGDSRAVFTNLPYGKYRVEINAVGYLSAYQEALLMGPKASRYDILLHRDPAAVNLDVADHISSAKARKEAKRAITELRSRNTENAEKYLDEADRSQPDSAEVNFLMGYWYFQNENLEKASKYLITATTLSPQTLLGRVCLEREDYPAARAALERAIAVDDKSWLPHDLLADAYLRERNFQKARDEAQSAITKGKTAANPAQLVLGQALINLGFDGEGIQALEAFLHEAPSHPIAGQVQRLIAEVRERQSAAGADHNDAKTKVRVSGVDPLRALSPP